MERGVKTSIVRLSQVHDTHKQGAETPAMQVARAKRESAYVGDGSNRWSAVHVSDVARLYRLAFEKAEGGPLTSQVFCREPSFNAPIARLTASAGSQPPMAPTAPRR